MRPAFDIAQLQRIAHLHMTWGPRGRKTRLRFLSLALCGEAGEFANVVKKDWRGDADRQGKRRAKMIDELSDVGAYAFMLAAALRISLPECIVAKMRKVERRLEYKRNARKRRGRK